MNMTDHFLDITRGEMLAQNFQHVAGIDAAVTIDIYEGRVCYIDPTSAKWKTGLPDTNKLWTMPYFIMGSSTRPDTAGVDGGDPAADYRPYAVVQVAPKLTGVPAIAGFEVETTEFDTTDTYAPNDPLTATPADTVQATGGLVVKASSLAKPMCGLVGPRGEITKHGKAVLSLYMLCFPRITAL